MLTPPVMLQGNALCKRYQLKRTLSAPSGLLTAVDNVSLELHQGETLGIAGESGCGKSTLGKVLCGLLRPDGGELRYFGQDPAAMSARDHQAFRRQTQMIFQDPFSSLNPRMRIGDIIAEPLVLVGSGTASSRRNAVETLMQRVGLEPGQYNRFPHEFSGGQRQRIGIARALASAPGIIIADEPVSSLDVSIQAQIINLLQEMKSAYSLSLIIISHDLTVLRHMCDRVCIMYLGALVESAPAADLFRRCLHPYTEALLAAIPTVNRSRSGGQPILKDDLPSPLAIPSGCRFHTRCRYARELCRQQSPPLEEKQSGHLAACHFSAEIFLKP